MLEKLKYGKEIREFKYNLAMDIRDLRILNHLSIEELSKASDISIHHLQNFEIGNVRDWTMFSKLLQFYKKKFKIIFY